MDKLQQARAWQPSGNIPDHANNLVEPLCVTPINSGYPRNSFTKDLAGTFVVPATIAVNAQPDPHRKPLPGKIAQPTRVSTVLSRRHSIAKRTSGWLACRNQNLKAIVMPINSLQNERAWVGEHCL
jgi:hypothetical protein